MSMNKPMTELQIGLNFQNNCETLVLLDVAIVY